MARVFRSTMVDIRSILGPCHRCPDILRHLGGILVALGPTAAFLTARVPTRVPTCRDLPEATTMGPAKCVVDPVAAGMGLVVAVTDEVGATNAGSAISTTPNTSIAFAAQSLSPTSTLA